MVTHDIAVNVIQQSAISPQVKSSFSQMQSKIPLTTYQDYDQFGNPSVHMDQEVAKPECIFLQHPFEKSKTGLIR